MDEPTISSNTMGIYPNPMVSTATLSLQAVQKENVTVAIYDQLGKQIYAKPYTVIPGQNSIELHRHNLSTGLYFVKILGNQFNTEALKLLVK